VGQAAHLALPLPLLLRLEQIGLMCRVELTGVHAARVIASDPVSHRR
jgi:hypothetical protein